MDARRKLLSYDTNIKGCLALTVGDFWRWAYSDILSNRNRAIFAEFLVASALGQMNCPRKEWDAVDICYNGFNIEVKSSGYLQSWQQNKPSIVNFEIAKKKPWYADTNTTGSELIRASDIYVFCLFAEKDSSKANILDIAQWQFYILITKFINSTFGDIKRISLSRIEKACQAVQYCELKNEIDKLINSGGL